MTTSLGEEYPKAQARCRELLEQYISIGPAGQLGHMAITAVLKRADEAAISGDVVDMMRSFQEMQDCQ